MTSLALVFPPLLRHNRITPGVVPELAFRPRCYVAADHDPHWITKQYEVPLAAFLTSSASGEQVPRAAPGILFFQGGRP